MQPQFTDEQIAQASENARNARIRRAATSNALDKQRAALKGMETSRDRGNFINPTRFDARRHEIANLEAMLAKDEDAVKETEMVLGNMVELNKIEAERVQREWIDAVKETYSEYGFRSWGGGMEICIMQEGIPTSWNVTVYFPRKGYRGEIEPATVNWSAHGSIEPQMTRRYARLMETACAIADQATADQIVSGW